MCSTLHSCVAEVILTTQTPLGKFPADFKRDQAQIPTAIKDLRERIPGNALVGVTWAAAESSLTLGHCWWNTAPKTCTSPVGIRTANPRVDFTDNQIRKGKLHGRPAFPICSNLQGRDKAQIGVTADKTSLGKPRFWGEGHLFCFPTTKF